MKDKRVVFMGTPEFSVPVLEMLIEKCNVVLVVSQPDSFVGRKKELKFSAVKEVAVKNGIPVFQPNKIREDYNAVIDAKPDIIITCAYGQIIPKILLDYPKYGAVNVHASLLPKYRGGSPIHRCIMNGDDKTGITIMYMAPGMDDGDIIAQSEISIDFCDNVGIVHDKLSVLGSKFLYEILPDIFSGNASRVKQDECLVSFAYNIKREEERLDFNDSVINVYNKIRGLYPFPGAYFMIDGEVIKVSDARISEELYDGEIGKIVSFFDDGFGVRCADGVIVITRLKPAGKKEMSCRDYINGKRKENLLGKKLC